MNFIVHVYFKLNALDFEGTVGLLCIYPFTFLPIQIDATFWVKIKSIFKSFSGFVCLKKVLFNHF